MMMINSIKKQIQKCSYSLSDIKQIVGDTEYKCIDGPVGYPIVNNLFSISLANLHNQTLEWAQVYGPIFKMSIFRKDIIVLSNIDLINKAFNNREANCLNQRCETVIGRYIIPEGIAANVCPMRVRKSKLFLQTELRHLYDGKGDDVYAVSLKEWLDPITVGDEEGKAIDQDINTGLKSMCADYISRQLIGDIIPESDPDREILWDFGDNLFTMVDPSVDGPLKMFPFLRHLPGYYGDIYRATIEARDKVAKRFFTDHKASYVHGRVRGLVDVCIMTQMEEEMKTGSSWLTDDYIKGLIYDTLAAGMTELLKSLRLFMLLMAHHPDVQTKIYAEIDSIIGSRFPEGCDRQWMPYTHAVMLELWRYGSQTPLAIPHLCNKDIVLEGYLIKKGSVILPNLYGIHHDEAIWGDPWTFRPDRFLDERGAMLPSDHKYLKNVIPFSIGQRACPGQDFARSRIFIGMTSLLQRVQISPPVNTKLPSADPRLYTKKYPLTEPEFECRILSRENIVI